MTRNRIQASLARVISQLKNRKVVRVAVAYVVIAWIMMQVGDVTFEALSLPPWSLTLFIALVVLGFPIALALAWAYEITPSGIVRDTEGRGSIGLAPSSSGHAALFSGSAPLCLAVFPFEDMSREGDLEYFCEGLAEEIITILSHVRGVRVAARMGAFEFGAKSADIALIREKLGVAAFLEGSVRKEGAQLRVAAQVVESRDGMHIWSGEYDRPWNNILELQRSLANTIVKSFQFECNIPDLIDPDASLSHAADEFYLRGQGYLARLTPTNVLFARQMFQKAIDLDPECARAWALLACTHACEFMHFFATDEHREKARDLSIKALELAPSLVESQVARGVAHLICGEYAEADLRFDRALEIEPESFQAAYFKARSKVQQGEPKEAAELFGRAAAAKPTDFQCLILQSSQLWKLGAHDASVKALKAGLANVVRFLEINPDESRAWGLGAFALLRLGEEEKAEQWINHSLDCAPRHSTSTYNAACFYARKGESEKALDYLQQCAKVGIVTQKWVEHDADLDGLREHPRFADIVAGFPAEPLQLMGQNKRLAVTMSEND